MLDHETLMLEAENKMVLQTPFNRVTRGSKLQVLLAAIYDNIGDTINEVTSGQFLSLVNIAEGELLDQIADLFGLERDRESLCYALSTEYNVKLYVETGTFGNINNGNDIHIPEGTALTTAGSNTIAYELSEDVVLPAGESSVFISVNAVDVGAEYRVGAGRLTQLDFSEYAEYSKRLLLATNLAPIANGNPPESDASFRYRITHFLASSQAANRTAIEDTLMTLPGVEDIALIARKWGVGTTQAILQTASGTVSEDLVSLAERVLRDVVSAGEYIKVSGPEIIGASIEATVVFQKGTSSAAMNSSISSIKASLRQEILQLGLGAPFRPNSLIDTILGFPGVISVGRGTQAFDAVYVYIQPNGSNIRRRESLVADLVDVEASQRVVPEPSLKEPFVIKGIISAR